MSLPRNIRARILNAINCSGEGHLGSCFSIVELLLGFGRAVEADPDRFSISEFILSKGHASYAYYSWLTEIGLMKEDEFLLTGQVGSKLYGHLPFIDGDERFQFGSGSLGHGFPFALGCAVSNVFKGNGLNTCCLIGDGEANEGTTWETLLLMNKFPSASLTILVDMNGSSERAVPIAKQLMTLSNVFPSICFQEVDGHNADEVAEAILGNEHQKVILCQTHKGFPCPTLLDNPIWHHRVPSEKELKLLLKELAVA